MNDDHNPSEGEDHPSDDETDPIEAKGESKLSDRKLLYQELDSLIIEACQHPPDSFPRRRLLNKIVIKLTLSGLKPLRFCRQSRVGQYPKSNSRCGSQTPPTQSVKFYT
jgi:hypothetical protein